MKMLLKITAISIVQLFWLTSIYGQQNINQKEYIRAIYNIEKTIWSLNEYIIDTTDSHWTATDPTGFFSFEGERYKGDPNTGYNIKLKSYIYSEEYFTIDRNIECTYYIGGTNRNTLVLNTGSEVIDDELPFDINEVKVVYLEKKFFLFPSYQIVFDRIDFDIRYVITLKDNSKKTYLVNSITRKFEEVD